jgi:20S proteasome alpha/beta subunit
MNRDDVLRLLRDLLKKCIRDDYDRHECRVVTFDPEQFLEEIEKELKQPDASSS